MNNQRWYKTLKLWRFQVHFLIYDGSWEYCIQVVKPMLDVPRVVFNIKIYKFTFQLDYNWKGEK